MSTSTINDQIRLSVPADPEYLKLARLTAAGLASRAGFTYDEIEDLRIAVGELCSLLVNDVPREAALSLTYVLEGDAMRIDGECEAAGGGGGSAEVAELSAQILAAVVDEHSVDGTTFTLRKRRARG